MQSILKIDSLCKNFGGLQALKDVSFSIGQGEIIGLIGPNGAGKTTCFNCIAGVESPSSGSILFSPANTAFSEDGLEIAGKKPEQVTKLGIARTFQNIKLFDALTVLDNVKIGRHCRYKSNAFGAIFQTKSQREEEKDIEKSAIEFLEFVGLTKRYNDMAASLPYGDQRRLEIARALATGPQLIMLDEPAAGMNPQESKELMELIFRVRDQGITVLLIEHDMKVVMGVCERVVVINYGKWLAEGRPEAVAKDLKVIEAYLGSGAVCDA